jgi:hypothetical protein
MHQTKMVIDFAKIHDDKHETQVTKPIWHICATSITIVFS